MLEFTIPNKNERSGRGVSSVMSDMSESSDKGETERIDSFGHRVMRKSDFRIERKGKVNLGLFPQRINSPISRKYLYLPPNSVEGFV